MEQVLCVWMSCNHCGAISPVPRLSDFNYGQFILRASSIHFAYLDIFDDRYFEEAYAMVKEYQSYSKGNRGDAIQDVIGKLFGDSDINEVYYEISRHFQCPVCDSKDYCVIEYSESYPKLVMIIPLVAHEAWSQMTREERRERLDMVMKEKGFVADTRR